MFMVMQVTPNNKLFITRVINLIVSWKWNFILNITYYCKELITIMEHVQNLLQSYTPFPCCLCSHYGNFKLDGDGVIY